MFEEELKLNNGSKVFVVAETDFESASGYEAAGVDVAIKGLFFLRATKT